MCCSQCFMTKNGYSTAIAVFLLVLSQQWLAWPVAASAPCFWLIFASQGHDQVGVTGPLVSPGASEGAAIGWDIRPGG